MLDISLQKESVIISYRAVINGGQNLRDDGILSGSCDVLFLYGSDGKGNERQLCWLEMDEAHGSELDELMDSLPREGVLAVVRAMVERSNAINKMIDVVKAAKSSQ